MPDGDPTQPQEGANTQTPEAGSSTSTRSIDSFPPEAQDYIRRLRDENAGHRTKLKETNQKLQEYEDRNKSESQKLADRAEAAERAAAESTARLLRYEVAADKGLPMSLAGRLQGSSKEELEADAEKLKKDFGLAESESTAGRPSFDGGVRRPVQKPKSMNEFLRQASGR